LSLNSVVKEKHTVRVALIYKGKVLLLQKGVGSGQWELPGGNPENGATEFDAGMNEFTQEVDQHLGELLRAIGILNTSNGLIGYSPKKRYPYQKNGESKSGEASLITINLDKIPLNKDSKILQLLEQVLCGQRLLEINKTKKESGGFEDNHVDYKFFGPFELLELAIKLQFINYAGKESVLMMNHTIVRLVDLLPSLGLNYENFDEIKTAFGSGDFPNSLFKIEKWKDKLEAFLRGNSCEEEEKNKITTMIGRIERKLEILERYGPMIPRPR
jgi:8-oxo-dGTP pyrophosphatase MutT (NUDIX family)